MCDLSLKKNLKIMELPIDRILIQIRDKVSYLDGTEEKLIEIIAEQSEEIKRALSPVIDQFVLCKIKRQTLPYTGCEPQLIELRNIEEYLINLMHQILGYTPAKD